MRRWSASSGDLHVFENRQGGEFREMSLAGLSGVVSRWRVGDVNGDGALDLVTLDAPGRFAALSFGADGLEQQTLAHLDRSHRSGRSRRRTRCSSRTSTTTARSIWWRPGGGRSRVWLADETSTLRAAGRATRRCRT